MDMITANCIQKCKHVYISIEQNKKILTFNLKGNEEKYMHPYQYKKSEIPYICLKAEITYITFVTDTIQQSGTISRR